MNESFQNLRFDRRLPALRSRIVAVAVASVGFTLMWVLIPHSGLYYVMLPVIAALAWAASYGWRQALAIVIAQLRRLEQM